MCGGDRDLGLHRGPLCCLSQNHSLSFSPQGQSRSSISALCANGSSSTLLHFLVVQNQMLLGCAGCLSRGGPSHSRLASCRAQPAEHKLSSSRALLRPWVGSVLLRRGHPLPWCCRKTLPRPAHPLPSFFIFPSLSPVLLCPPDIVSPRSLTPTMVGTWAASVAESQSG